MNNCQNVAASTKGQQDVPKKHISFASPTFPQFSMGSCPESNNRSHNPIQGKRKATPYRPPSDSSSVALFPPSPYEPKPFKPVDTSGFRESPVMQKLPFQLFGWEKGISVGGQENVVPSFANLKSGKCADCPRPVVAGLARCLDCETSPFGSNGSFTFNGRAAALRDDPLYKPFNENGSNKRLRMGCAPKVVPKVTFPKPPLSLMGKEKGSFAASTSASKTNNVVGPENPPSTPKFFGIMGEKLPSSSTSSSEAFVRSFVPGNLLLPSMLSQQNGLQSPEVTSASKRSGIGGLARTPLPTVFTQTPNLEKTKSPASTISTISSPSLPKKSKKHSSSKLSKKEFMERIEFIEATEKQKPPVAAGLSATGRPMQATKGTVARKPTLEKVVESQAYQLTRAAYDNSKLLHLVTQAQKQLSEKEKKMSEMEQAIASLQAQVSALHKAKEGTPKTATASVPVPKKRNGSKTIVASTPRRITRSMKKRGQLD